MIRLLDDVERLLLAFVSRLGPWLSPIAPAYAVYRAALQVLGWPQWVAVAMALAIEAAGVSAFHLTMRMWSWNREKRASDPVAPAWVGIALVVVYLVVGIGLAVVIGLVPGLVPFAPAAFFVIAGVGYAVLGLMVDQARRERVVASERTRQREERKERKREAAQRMTADKRMLVQRIAEFDQALDELKAQAGGSDFAPSDVQDWVAVGRTRAYELLSYGVDLGRVERLGSGRYRIHNNHTEEG